MNSYKLFTENDFSGTLYFDNEKIVRYTGWILIDGKYKSFENNFFTFNKNILNELSMAYFENSKKSNKLYENKYWFNKHVEAGICLNYCNTLKECETDG